MENLPPDAKDFPAEEWKQPWPQTFYCNPPPKIPNLEIGNPFQNHEAHPTPSR